MRYSHLPEGYVKHDEIDLDRGPRARTLRCASLAVALVLLIVGLTLQDITLHHFTQSPMITLLLLPCLFTCIAGHELLHGAMMRLFSGVRPRYGRRGLVPHTGSSAYFSKAAYLVIVLAPVVVMGLVLQLLMLRFPGGLWFYAVLQLVNLSGSVSDLYLAFRALRAPRQVLLCDIGTVITLYVPTKTV